MRRMMTVHHKLAVLQRRMRLPPRTSRRIRAGANPPPRLFSYNLPVDYRFKYKRYRPSPEEESEEQRVEHDAHRRMRGLAIGMSIPISLVGGPVGGWLLGNLLDGWLGTGWIMPTLLIAGTIAGFKLTIDMLKKLSET
jgi:F0F1-type ATP synthase assembly protein I